MSDTSIRYDRRIDTRPFLPFILSPEVSRRLALEDDKKEVEDGEGDHGQGGEVDDVLV